MATLWETKNTIYALGQSHTIQKDSLKVMPGTVLNMMEVYDDLDAFIAKNIENPIE